MAQLQKLVGPQVEIRPDRTDVVNAVNTAIHAVLGKDMDVFPTMSNGASDGAFFAR